MIASIEEYRKKPRLESGAEQAEEDSVTVRFGEMVAKRPAAYVVAAVTLGVAIGWIVKRKLG